MIIVLIWFLKTRFWNTLIIKAVSSLSFVNNKLKKVITKQLLPRRHVRFPLLHEIYEPSVSNGTFAYERSSVEQLVNQLNHSTFYLIRSFCLFSFKLSYSCQSNSNRAASIGLRRCENFQRNWTIRPHLPACISNCSKISHSTPVSSQISIHWNVNIILKFVLTWYLSRKFAPNGVSFVLEIF